MTDLSALTPGTWTIDPGHTTVGFVGRHLVVAKVRGRFTGVTGTVTIAPEPLESSVEVVIDAASVHTGDESRDGHLRSADFFDVEQHPTWTYRSTQLIDKGDEYVLVGDLTIKGVTRSVELDLSFDGVGPDPWGGTRAGFTAEGEINRKDWGLVWNVALETGGVLVGEKVKLQLDVELIKA